MLDWITEIFVLRDIKMRLKELENRGLELLDQVNKSSEQDNVSTEAKIQNKEAIQKFRKDIEGSLILGSARILRVQNDGLGRFAEADRDHTREVLNRLVLNLDVETRSIGHETNFRIAIGTALLAVIAAVLAMVSAIFDVLSFLFKD